MEKQRKTHWYVLGEKKKNNKCTVCTTVMKCTTDSHCNKENVSNQRGSIIS